MFNKTAIDSFFLNIEHIYIRMLVLKNYYLRSFKKGAPSTIALFFTGPVFLLGTCVYALQGSWFLVDSPPTNVQKICLRVYILNSRNVNTAFFPR